MNFCDFCRISKRITSFFLNSLIKYEIVLICLFTIIIYENRKFFALTIGAFSFFVFFFSIVRNLYVKIQGKKLIKFKIILISILLMLLPFIDQTITFNFALISFVVGGGQIAMIFVLNSKNFLKTFILLNEFLFILWYKNYQSLNIAHLLFLLNFIFLKEEKKFEDFEQIINDCFPNPFVIMNNECKKMIFCNQAAEKCFEIDNKERFEKFLLDIVISKTDESLFKHILENFSMKKCKFLHVEANLGDKSEKKENFDIFVTQTSFQSEECFILVMNVIPKEVLKNYEEKEKFKNSLISTVSHDLRLPLNGIMGLLELLLPRINDCKSKSYLKMAMNLCHFIFFLLCDYLDYAQINNNKLVLDIRAKKISDTLKFVVDLMTFQCERKNIKFIFENNLPQKDIIIATDHRRLQQILLNFIGNSLKFTKSGYIKLFAKLHIENKKKYIYFAIEDTGIGIKAENFRNLFSEFWKLPQNEKEINPNGLGLGLHISKTLINELNSGSKHKENIEIKSEFGKGSVFSFYIFSHEPKEIEEDEISEEGGSEEKLIYTTEYNPSMLSVSGLSSLKSSEIIWPKKKKIFIIDDDQCSVFVMGEYMKKMGFEYESANDGKEALQILKYNLNFDLILMDIFMPFMCGFEISYQIKQMAKENNKKIPIIGVSGDDSPNLIKKCKGCGIDYFIGKPVSFNKIKQIIDEIFSGNKEKS